MDRKERERHVEERKVVREKRVRRGQEGGAGGRGKERERERERERETCKKAEREGYNEVKCICGGLIIYSFAG